MPITTLVSYSIERVKVLAEDGTVDQGLMPALSQEDVRRLYEHMVLTRRLDERMFTLQRQGRLGTFARVTGQEGAHVGAAFALRPEDWLVPASARPAHCSCVASSWNSCISSGAATSAAVPSHPARAPFISVPVGTHMLHAVGIGWAMRQSGQQAAVLPCSERGPLQRAISVKP